MQFLPTATPLIDDALARAVHMTVDGTVKWNRFVALMEDQS